MMALGILAIIGMVASSAVAVGAVLRAPLVQEWHIRQPEPARWAVTARVIPPVQPSRPRPDGRPALPPRVIRGEVTSRKDQPI